MIGATLGMSVAAASAATLDDVKARGHLQCGVNTGTPGFGALDQTTNDWAGFDVDYCRALAAAIFNDPKSVQFTPLTAAERFTALQSGEVDVLFRNTTWTMSRDTQQGLAFTGVNYYDGQGFMVRKETQRRLDEGAERRDRLRADGHDDRAQPCRLLPGPGDDVHARGLRGAGGGERGLRLGRLRRLHHRCFRSCGHPPDAVGPGRPRAAARGHLEGAARACRAAGRRPVVHDRALAALRARERGGGWRHRGERRGDEGQRRREHQAPARDAKASSARASGSTTPGPRTRSRRWAITARSSSATSASPRRSACRAASTRCGPKAAFSTDRRSASRI